MISTNSKSNGKQFIWTIIGNGSYALSQFLTIIIIGKFLDAKSVGIYSFALAIVTPLLIFLNLGLRMQLMTDIKKEIPVEVYKKTQKIMSFIGIFIVIIMCSIFSFEYEITAIIIIIALMKSVEYQSELYYGYLQRNKMNKLVSYSLILKSISFLTSLIICVYFNQNLINTVLFSAIVYCLVGIIYDRYKIIKKIEFSNEKINKNYIIKIMKIGLPLSMSTLLISLNVNLPRVVLGKYNIEQLGYFASVVAFMQIGTLFTVSIGQVISGKMANNYHNGNYDNYYKIAFLGALTAFLIGILFVLFSYFFGNKIMKELLGYTSENMMFYIFLMAPFQYMMTIFGYIQGATRKSKKLLIVNSIVFFIISLLSAILIPKYEIYGLISTITIAFIIGCLIYSLILINGFRKQVRS